MPLPSFLDLTLWELLVGAWMLDWDLASGLSVLPGHSPRGNHQLLVTKLWPSLRPGKDRIGY